MEEKKRTVFCDIDGTIFKYRKFETYKEVKAELTPHTLDKMKEWRRLGYMIVLTTARPEEYRNHTVKELLTNDVPWDRLVMGIGRGARYVVNDHDPSQRYKRAVAYSIPRDEGLKNVKVNAAEEVIPR